VRGRDRDAGSRADPGGTVVVPRPAATHAGEGVGGGLRGGHGFTLPTGILAPLCTVRNPTAGCRSPGV
jgi:hypothetical protein